MKTGRKYNVFVFKKTILLILSFCFIGICSLQTTKAEAASSQATNDSTLTLKWKDTTDTTELITGLKDSAGAQTVGLELTYSLGGTDDAAAGEIVIKMPYAMFKDRDGNQVGTVTPPTNLVSKVQYDAGSRSSGGNYYYYYEDTDNDGKYDNIVFVNYDTVKASYYFIADVNYNTGILKNIKDGYSKTDISASAAFTKGGTIQTTNKTNDLTVKVTTNFPTPYVQKKLTPVLDGSGGKYMAWQDSWTSSLGIAKPSDADDYVYAVADIQDLATSTISSQPYLTTFTETPGNGGKVIAWYSDAKKVLKINSTQLKTVTSLFDKNYFSSSDYDAVLDPGADTNIKVHTIIAYPKTALTYDQAFKDAMGIDSYYGTVTNDATVTNTGRDDETTTGTASLSIEYPKLDASAYIYTGNQYSVNKNIVSPAINRKYPGALNVLLGGSSVSENGYIGGSTRYYSKYNNGKTYDMILQDDNISLDGELLNAGDYEFTSVYIGKSTLTLYEENLTGTKWNETAVADRSKYPPLSVYAYVNGAWQKIKDVDMGPLSAGETVSVPEGTTRIKTVVSGLSQSARISTVSIYFKINPTDHVKSIINGHTLTDGLTSRMVNYDAMIVKDQEGNILNPISLSNIIGDIPKQISANDEKEYGAYLQRDNDYSDFTYVDMGHYVEAMNKTSTVGSTINNKYVPITYNITNTRRSVATGDVINKLPDSIKNDVIEGLKINGQVFYDLLPKGGIFDASTIKITDNYKNSNIGYTYKTVDNWKGTGRTMVIIKATEPTSGYTPDGYYAGGYYYMSGINVTFKVYYDLNDLGTYGLTKINQSEGINDDIMADTKGNINTGHLDDGKSFTNNTAEWKDVNDDGNTATAVTEYSVTNTLNVPLASEIGFHKQIKGSEDTYYSDMGTSVGGGEYTYKLSLTNGINVKTTGVVMYDVLENAAEKYTGDSATKYWKGVLESIDATNATDKGIKPVIYYSTTSGLDPYTKATDKDLGNTVIWSKTVPSDMSKVTAIAIDLSKKADGTDYIWAEKETCNVFLKMKAPTNVNDYVEPIVYAYNQAGSAITYSLSTGGTSYDKIEQANIVRNQLSAPSTEIHKTSTPATGTENSPTKVEDGSNLDYDVYIKNTGGSVYTDATVVDTIPAELNIDAANIKVYSDSDASKAVLLSKDSNVTMTQSGQKLTFVVKELLVKGEYHFIIPTKVNTDDATFVNQATLTKANGVDVNKDSEIMYHKVTPTSTNHSSPDLKKTVTGPGYPTGENYTFTLTADSSNPENGETGLATSATIKSTALENDTHTLSDAFGTGTFSKAGTYKYTIKETAGNTKGMTYDVAEYQWTVTVGTDMKATTTLTKVNDSTGNTANTGVKNYTYDTTNYNVTYVAAFTNIYKASGTVNNPNNSNNSNNPNNPNKPQTGDNSNIMIWLTVMILSLLCIGICLIAVRKRKCKK